MISASKTSALQSCLSRKILFTIRVYLTPDTFVNGFYIAAILKSTPVVHDSYKGHNSSIVNKIAGKRRYQNLQIRHDSVANFF